MNYKDKKVLVCGMAKSGISSAKLLNRLGAKVTIQDAKSRDKLGDEPKELGKLGISLYLGQNPDDIVCDMDLVVISPGIPCDLPFVLKARANDIKVISEIELAYTLCRCPIIAITGTNGKTTTTSLVGEIIRRYSKNTAVVGNIGMPFADSVLDLGEDSLVVAELSSFQLESIDTFKPKVSAVLNITPDHLNRHKTIESYILAKERIFENQDSDDFTILNYADSITRDMARRTKARVLYFSLNKEINDECVYSDDKSIYINALGHKGKVLDINEMRILGGHNVENAMSAILCCLAAGVPLDIIREGLKEFKAVEHRIEYVTSVGGVEFYNDSKGTNPDASIKAVEAMQRPICLIAGGYDKGSDFTKWISTFDGKVKFVAVIGVVSDDISAALDKMGFTNYKKAETFNEAIDFCVENAVQGDCVLLSPACASWDMFDSYEQRGDLFKEYVNKLG